MVEVSNRVLAGLLIVAIVVSLGGTFISLQKMRTISFSPLTGFATSDSGRVMLNVTTVAGIEFTSAYKDIDFGTGFVNASAYGKGGLKNTGNCTMWVNGTISAAERYAKDGNCLGEDWPTFDAPGTELPMELVNVGNTYVKIQMASNESISDFFPVVASEGIRSAQWVGVNNEANSCNDTEYATSMISKFTNISEANVVFCQCLNSTDSKDSLAIGAKVRVPYDLLSTYYKSYHRMKWTASATDLGSGALC